MSEQLIILDGAVAGVVSGPTQEGLPDAPPLPPGVNNWLGWRWVDGALLPPIVPSTPLMTHSAFLSRLSDGEHERLDGALQVSWQMRRAEREFNAAREIDVTDPRTITFVGALASAGILDAPAQQRIDSILSTISLSERGAIDPRTHEVTP